MALAYTALQLLAGVVAMRIWSRPGATSYKMGCWIILVLFVPVVGLILYLLWNGDRPSKRLSLKKPVPIEEPMAQQEIARTNLEKLRQTAPQWYPLAAYLSGKGFDLYRNTALCYLPTGEAYLEDMLTTLDTAQRFIFLEYFIMAEGEIWDRLSDILCRKSRQGVEVKLIFDDFGSMMRMPNEKNRRVAGRRGGGQGIQPRAPLRQPAVLQLPRPPEDHLCGWRYCLHRRRQYRRRVRQPDRTLRLLEGLRSPAGGRGRLGPDPGVPADVAADGRSAVP